MELKKFVFEDNGNTKVLIGYVISEDEHLYKVKAKRDGVIFDIGKRFIIKTAEMKDW